MKIKFWYLIGLLIVLVLLGVAYFSFFANRYTTTQARRGDIVEAVYGLGKVKSHKRFEVIIGVVSTVTRRLVEEGQAVVKGQPLIEFDSNVRFRAPFDGTVTLSTLYKGETALPHLPIVRVEDLNDCFIELSIEQQSILRVQPKQKAQVSFESIRGNILEGTVTSVFPRGDEFIAHVSVHNLDRRILPGMTADVSIEVGKSVGATLVPLSSIRNGEITVRRDGKWKKEKVKINNVDGIMAEIEGSDIKPLDEIQVRKRK